MKQKIVVSFCFAVSLLTACQKDVRNPGQQTKKTVPAVTSAAKSATIFRPLSDYLNAQGSTTLYVLPVPDFIGWFAHNGHFISVDYNGTSAAYLKTHHGIDLHTEVTGTVKERQTNDGRALITVRLHTTNALAFAATADPAYAENPYGLTPLDFGYRPQELIDNPSLPAALGWADLEVSFYNPAPGDPIPDLIDLFGTRFGDVQDLRFHAGVDGTFHALSGFPEGTAGKVKVDQVGLFNTGFHGAVADGFPVENVIYIGH